MEKIEKNIKSVSAQGHRFKVGQILELNVYGEDVDLEFLDENGNYHHYQSWHDKGVVVYEDE